MMINKNRSIKILPFKINTTVYTQSPFMKNFFERTSFPFNKRYGSANLKYFVFDGDTYWSTSIEKEFLNINVTEITFDDFLEKYLINL